MKLKHLIRALVAVFAATLVGPVAAANTPPVILDARATPNPMLWNQATVYSVAAQDADGDALTYRWLFADGLIATNAVATNRLPSGFNSNVVSVTVSDGHGGSATNTCGSAKWASRSRRTTGRAATNAPSS